jgi:hypothetical protein
MKHPGDYCRDVFFKAIFSRMKKIVACLITGFVFIVSCAHHTNQTPPALKRVDRVWLDSVIKSSDSSYKKPYKRTDFVTAEFYVNRRDSSVCQIMKDSVDTIRQIIIARKNTRIFFAQYYSNGQLQADLPLDEFGQSHGACAFYYESGQIQISGNYIHGLKTGEWKNCDKKGNLVSIDKYDSNGQAITTSKQN